MFSSSDLVHQIRDIDAIIRRGYQLQKRNQKIWEPSSCQQDLKAVKSFRDLALEQEDQPAARGAGEGGAGAAETLKTEKQSRGLKQDPEKEEEMEGIEKEEEKKGLKRRNEKEGMKRRKKRRKKRKE